LIWEGISTETSDSFSREQVDDGTVHRIDNSTNHFESRVTDHDEIDLTITWNPDQPDAEPGGSYNEVGYTDVFAAWRGN
jgi:hypothetical protein